MAWPAGAGRVPVPHRLAVAPMMGRTDRHFRYLVRSISRCTWLYTEMLVARALVHGDSRRLLAHSACESPVALQLGGSEPDVLAAAAELAAESGFDEVNLNVGCPSARVTSGRMGACLMAEPTLVAECVAAMGEAAPLPVTVKTRLGIDRNDDFEFLCRFAEAVAAAGCRTLIVHARKAWLSGLDPKANRTVPQLDHGRVFALKTRYPFLEVVVNGEIRDLDTAAETAQRADGAMIGRAAYARPLLLSEADRRLFGSRARPPGLAEVIQGYLAYLGSLASQPRAFAAALRHFPGILAGLPGARATRRHLAAAAASRDLTRVERALAPYLRAYAA